MSALIDSKLCVKCKGKLLCGLDYCPVLERFSARSRAASHIKGTDFYGSSPPGVFVSWHNYPKITLSALSPTTVEPNAALFDAPEQWFGLSEQRIISFRESLVGSGKKYRVKEASNPSEKLATVQELVMSSQPVNVEVSLYKKPSLKLSFHESIAPVGPKAPLKKLRLAENPRIPAKVDYLNADTNAKALTAVMELYSSGFPVSFLYKLLSAGVLGVEKKRRLVPTRFAITAIDDTISKKLIEEIKDFKEINDIQLFYSKYLGNTFFILLIPHSWAFEQMECWLPHGVWTEKAQEYNIIQDHEFYSGRKKYADNVMGAYYSARLVILEYLKEKKRQATAIVFREIGQDYNLPLGVWVIRETVRDAMKKKPLIFFDLNLALKYISRKLAVPLSEWKKSSRVLDFIQNQRSLKDFLAD